MSAAVLTMLLVLTFSLSVFADTAVVTTSDGGSVNMRVEASTDSDMITPLPDGTEVEVLGTEGDWSQVSYNGYTGYVMSTYLAAVETEETTEDTTEEITEDTEEDTAADTELEATVTEEDTEDTSEEEVEEESSDADSEALTELTEKLAQYKKIMMILALACLILLIIIINLLLFYRRGYDEYDDDEYDDDEDDDMHHGETAGKAAPDQQQYEPVQKQGDVTVPDMTRLVDDTAAEVRQETGAAAPQQTQRIESPQQTSQTQSGSDDDLEFFDLDDL